MAIRTELNLRLPNSPGALAGVCRLLSNERVNVLALSVDAGGQLRMVVDNHVHGGAAEGGATASVVIGVNEPAKAAAAAGV